MERWFQAILSGYPTDAARFLQKETDRFANPVGHAISKGTEILFDELLQGCESAKTSSALADIIRIRAVQDFSPSRAVGFLLLLKKAIREELSDEIVTNRLWDEVLAFEGRIEELTFSAFDIYMECREKLYELKATEVKKRTYRLLQRANLLEGDLDGEGTPDDAPPDCLAAQGGNGK